MSIEHTNDAGVTRVMDDELVPSLLDEAVYKQFWIEWSNLQLTVGQ